MSRRYHVRKTRSPSRYKERLAARGLTRTPVMSSIESLRAKQRRPR